MENRKETKKKILKLNLNLIREKKTCEVPIKKIGLINKKHKKRRKKKKCSTHRESSSKIYDEQASLSHRMNSDINFSIFAMPSDYFLSIPARNKFSELSLSIRFKYISEIFKIEKNSHFGSINENISTFCAHFIDLERFQDKIDCKYNIMYKFGDFIDIKGKEYKDDVCLKIWGQFPFYLSDNHLTKKIGSSKYMINTINNSAHNVDISDVETKTFIFCSKHFVYKSMIDASSTTDILDKNRRFFTFFVVKKNNGFLCNKTTPLFLPSVYNFPSVLDDYRKRIEHHNKNKVIFKTTTSIISSGIESKIDSIFDPNQLNILISFTSTPIFEIHFESNENIDSDIFHDDLFDNDFPIKKNIRDFPYQKNEFPSPDKRLSFYQPSIYGDLVSFFNICKFSIEYRLLICKQVIYQILLVLESIHSRGYAHRDIKLDNILVVDTNLDLKRYKSGDLSNSSGEKTRNYDINENSLKKKRKKANKTKKSSSSRKKQNIRECKKDKNIDYVYVWVKLCDWEFTISLNESFLETSNKKADEFLMEDGSLPISGTFNYASPEMIIRKCNYYVYKAFKDLSGTANRNMKESDYENYFGMHDVQNFTNMISDLDVSNAMKDGFFDQKYDPMACDIFALGFCLVYMCLYTLPRVSLSDLKQLDVIDKKALSFFQACCNPFASERWSASELLNHEFITSDKSLARFKKTEDFSGIVVNKIIEHNDEKIEDMNKKTSTSSKKSGSSNFIYKISKDFFGNRKTKESKPKKEIDTSKKFNVNRYEISEKKSFYKSVYEKKLDIFSQSREKIDSERKKIGRLEK